nr:DUF447 family protein [Candidatus Sigynarchaeota archaeon]
MAKKTNAATVHEKFKAQLYGFELKKGFLYETIVSTYDLPGKSHVAPIGVRMLAIEGKDKHLMEAKIYATSKMYACLCKSKECVIHFPGYHQLEFYFTAFRKEIGEGLHDLEKSWTFTNSKVVNAPVIETIGNYIEARVKSMETEIIYDGLSSAIDGQTTRGIFLLESRSITVKEPSTLPVNRQGGILLEFLVEASRMQFQVPGSSSFEMKKQYLLAMVEKMEQVAPGDGKNHMAKLLLDRVINKDG